MGLKVGGPGSGVSCLDTSLISATVSALVELKAEKLEEKFKRKEKQRRCAETNQEKTTAMAWPLGRGL